MGGVKRKMHNASRKKVRKFAGNTHTRSNDSPVSVNETAEEESFLTSPAAHKISGTFKQPSMENGFRIVDISILIDVFERFTLCTNCRSQTLRLQEIPEQKKGMAYKLQLFCSTCDFTSYFLHQVRPVTYMNKLIPINNVVMNTIQWYLNQISV